MNEILDFINSLIEKGAHLYLDGEELKVNAPKDFFTPSIVQQIKDNKEQIKKVLKDSSNFGFEIPQLPNSPTYDLSHAQRRLWILSQFPESSLAYNISNNLQFEGSLDMEILNDAMVFLTRRHESLRTVFKLDESGELRQSIIPEADCGFKIDFCDLNNQSDQANRLSELLKEEQSIVSTW